MSDILNPDEHKSSDDMTAGIPGKKLVRIQDAFSWSPKVYTSVTSDRQYHWPNPPYKKETRIPLYWLARKGLELFFVNSSEETLDLVSVHTGGCVTSDDSAVSITDDVGYTYHDVKPNEAVKVDEYDDFYDLDFLLQVSLRIESKKEGVLNILTWPQKGGIGETIIMWSNGESGKVTITKE